MTAIAVMQCVERGQIGLDDPIGNICPEMADPEVIEGFEEDGTPRMRKAERKITLRCGLCRRWMEMFAVDAARYKLETFCKLFVMCSSSSTQEASVGAIHPG